MIINTKNIRGFTLLELLAVLIIMAALMSIVVPIFKNKGNEARIRVHNENIKILKKQANMYMLGHNVKKGTDITCDLVESGLLKEIPKNPLPKDMEESESYRVKIDIDGNIKINVSYVDILTRGKLSSTDLEYNEFKGVNRPYLLQGMVPVYYDGSNWVEVDEEDSNWYKYNGDINNESDSNKNDGIIANLNGERWANTKLKDGSMFVWIPRYAYKIEGKSTPENSSDDRIRIRYSKGIFDYLSNGYLTHPAFKIGSKELTGIWVAKFEASSVEGYESGANGNQDDVITKTVQIKPNVSSWRRINVSNAFKVCKDMRNNSRYGWNLDSGLVDTHLMRNSEWGAVAYLTEAIRDGEEVWINNYVDSESESKYNTLTGACAKIKNTGPSNDVNVFGSFGSEKASTTGEIHGIYDMSGGAWEYQAAYINNGHTYLLKYGFELLKEENSRWVEVYPYDSSADGGGLNKAFDVANANFKLWKSKKGDAIYEIAYGVAGYDFDDGKGWITDKGKTNGWHPDYGDFTLGG